LAAAIAQRDQATKELADIRDAIAPAKRIVAEAERVLAQAASALNETKHEVAQRIAQAFPVGS
jgi:hypothetical protein